MQTMVGLKGSMHFQQFEDLKFQNFSRGGMPPYPLKPYCPRSQICSWFLTYALPPHPTPLHEKSWMRSSSGLSYVVFGAESDKREELGKTIWLVYNSPEMITVSRKQYCKHINLIGLFRTVVYWLIDKDTYQCVFESAINWLSDIHKLIQTDWKIRCLFIFCVNRSR